ncbi:glycosyltransferase family 87 protein [Chitinophaga japonensis]|uniref:Uncharacterized protein DUF2029 n=1 Tax=Chitinophaga japonensis TaxID=104662 RepID=A0A562T1E9_CHIJA|nr:glycosyltransferase family 87 protein [Chitinophaga japonensis]TWI86720.1 uncharacterized protein DUF2029 [Chitinophaga japonensis]
MEKSTGILPKKRFTLTWLGEKEWLALLLWFGLSIIVAVKEMAEHNINNYIIFKHVYLHLRQLKPLYIAYPEYFDVNMYGPVFSVIIAPFALLPDFAGAMLWVIANAAFLYFAIRQLPLSRLQQNLVLIFASHELMSASSYFQFNPSVAACIILSFALIQKGKDFWAAFFIVIATLTKLYGVVGLAFFFFSNHRWRLIGSLLFWAAVLFALPMLLSTPQYIVQTYREWGQALVAKNQKNYQFEQGIVLQNISVMGFIQRVFHLRYLNNLWVLVPAVFLFLSHYLRLAWKDNRNYQLYLLCSTLLFTVIFSTSSESPTYIIAFPAACIWYVLQYPTRWNNAFFIFLLIGCSFSHSDLVTAWVKRNIVVPYAFKVFPCLVLWLVIVYQVLGKQFLRLKQA